jgi:hypothetical protein
MQFRDAIEQDARDLQELAERAAKASGRPDFLPTLAFEGNDYAAHERQLEAAAMAMRRSWLQVSHRSADTTLKSPCEDTVAQIASGREVSFGYEREIDVSLLEQRGSGYIDREPGWSSDVVLFRSGQAALACLLHFAITRYSRSNALSIAHAGAYFETVALLQSWPTRVLHQVPQTNEMADIVLAEPVFCDGGFRCISELPRARHVLILDTTMSGAGYPLGPHLQAAECPLVVAYSSGLKLDQAGLELANVGIVRIYARDDVQSVGAALRDIRGLVGAGLTLDEMSALSAPWFMDRAYADRYAGAVFDHNRALATAIGSRSPVFTSDCHPSLQHHSADAPFCALRLNEPSPAAYRALEARVSNECERRKVLVAKGGSFGFRGHRFELIEPRPDRGQTFLRVAMGWRDGWSCRGLCELFGELAR